MVLVHLGSGPVQADVGDWRVNEVLASADGDADVRYVELYAPPSDVADNCFFSTTRIEVLGPDGALLGSVTPFGATTCYGGDTYFLFASPEAADRFGVTRDAPLTLPLPPDGGQLCFRSSATRYDCTRWGAVTAAVTDLAAPADTTAASALADGLALSRIADTGVVADDFALADPTPRQPNDGTIWYPPDAGPPPDADTTPDAEVIDARVFVDAPPPPPRPDGGAGQPSWMLADPGADPACSCRSGGARGGAVAGWTVLLGLVVAVIRRRPR